MKTESNQNLTLQSLLNTVVNIDCLKLMAQLPAGSIDFVLTDPPYLVRYRDRQGRTLANDDNDAWLKPAFSELYRVLRQDRFAIAFYGWNQADKFLNAFRQAGFFIAGHLVFRKRYASAVRYVRYRHESAYVLAKGRPAKPVNPIDDVLDCPYTGNKLHPTQKPVEALLPLIESFSRPGDIVLDPFCGSGSTLVAAHRSARRFIGCELDAQYAKTAASRLYAQPRC